MGPSIHAGWHTPPTPTLKMPRTVSINAHFETANPPHGASCGGDRPITIQLALPKIVTRRDPPGLHLRPRSDATASHPLSACCNVSKKANATSISNARLVYWPHNGQLAKHKQLCLASATCRAAPRAGRGSHRPFGRHQDACSSLTDALACAPCFARPPKHS